MVNFSQSAVAHLQRLALRLRDDKRGIETLEWAVVAAVVIVGAVLAYTGVENGVGSFFKELGVGLSNAGSVTL